MNDEEIKNEEEIDDVVFEPEDENEGVDQSVKIKKLQNDNKTLRKERDEYLTALQRMKADFINARKEEEKTRGEYLKSANKDLILDILTTLDNFDMAFSNKEAWGKVDQNWRIGVEYIYQSLLTTLEQNGLKQVNPIGETFDPNLHASVENIPIEKDEDEHKIMQVMQRGYTLNGALLRTPNVKVGVKN